ncbi:MAG: prepilin-type N-terminal cleavage/methylation domain-containing protein [Verrucomicrobia bacterium]|nr:prepilin-type N-terminal cleavage/methylation domain-containing protein [Verrucomicrobiota bacterium]
MKRSLAPDRRSAFSLVELMVVLVLIGVLSAMILPEMKGSFEDALLRSTARKLIDVFGLAYSRAVTLNQVQRVRLDRQTGRYTVEQSRTEDGQASGFAPVRDVPESQGLLDPRITLEIQTARDSTGLGSAGDTRFVSGADLAFGPREDAISFYPDGTADAAQVLLRDRAGFRLILRLNPITARAQVIAREPLRSQTAATEGAQ